MVFILCFQPNLFKNLHLFSRVLRDSISCLSYRAVYKMSGRTPHRRAFFLIGSRDILAEKWSLGFCFTLFLGIWWKFIWSYYSDIDECASNPCQHGSCHDKISTYICECNDGYSGINCDKGMKYLTGCFEDCSQRGKEDRNIMNTIFHFSYSSFLYYFFYQSQIHSLHTF